MEGLLFGDTSIGDVLRQSGASAFGLGTLNGLDGEVRPGSWPYSATATLFSCLVSTALYKVIYSYLSTARGVPAQLALQRPCPIVFAYVSTEARGARIGLRGPHSTALPL